MKTKKKVTAKKVVKKNTLFPGLPNYTGPNKGWFGLLHHRVLFEHSDNVKERVDYVRKHKAQDQRAIRLRNMVYMGKAFSDVCYAAQLHQNDGTKPERFQDFATAYIKMVYPGHSWANGGLTYADGRHMY